MKSRGKEVRKRYARAAAKGAIFFSGDGDAPHHHSQTCRWVIRRARQCILIQQKKREYDGFVFV
jgi:hypothetical protein